DRTQNEGFGDVHRTVLSSRPRAARRRRSLLAVAARGLRTLAVRILPAASTWSSCRRRGRTFRRLAVERGNVDMQAFAQPVGAVDHHVISGRQPGVDGGHAAVGWADGDWPPR